MPCLKTILYTMSLTHKRCFRQFPADYEQLQIKTISSLFGVGFRILPV